MKPIILFLALTYLSQSTSVFSSESFKESKTQPSIISKYFNEPPILGVVTIKNKNVKIFFAGKDYNIDEFLNKCKTAGDDFDFKPSLHILIFDKDLPLSTVLDIKEHIKKSNLKPWRFFINTSEMKNSKSVNANHWSEFYLDEIKND